MVDRWLEGYGAENERIEPGLVSASKSRMRLSFVVMLWVEMLEIVFEMTMVLVVVVVIVALAFAGRMRER